MSTSHSGASNSATPCRHWPRSLLDDEAEEDDEEEDEEEDEKEKEKEEEKDEEEEDEEDEDPPRTLRLPITTVPLLPNKCDSRWHIT